MNKFKYDGMWGHILIGGGPHKQRIKRQIIVNQLGEILSDHLIYPRTFLFSDAESSQISTLDAYFYDV